jgi:hypothetical protein
VEDGLGRDEACPAASCLEVLESDGSAGDGAYWLTLASGDATPVWCDMAGGGWTLGFVRNSVSAGSQGDFGQGEASVSQLATDPDVASASTEAVRSWHDLNDLAYDELVVTAHASGSTTYRSEAIPRGHLRVAFGDDGYLLYGGASPYFWCGGDRTFADHGVGAVNNPPGAPADCKSHGGLGSGWDFSQSMTANQGLTLCGGDGSAVMSPSWAGSWVIYGDAGAAQAIWVR